MKRKQAVVTVVIRTAVLVLLSCLLAGVVEFCLNAKLIFLPEEQKGIHELDLSKARLKKADSSKNGIQIDEEEAEITFSFDRQYVEKLTVQYDRTELIRAEIEVNGFNGYGNSEEKVYDFYYRGEEIHRGTVRIGTEADRLTFSFPAAKGAVIEHVWIENRPYFHLLRFLFFAVLFYLLSFLLVYRKVIQQRPEKAFVLIAALFGSFIILAVPPRNNGWDEQIHYQNAQYLISAGDRQLSETERDFMYLTEPVTASLEDRWRNIDYYNQRHQEVASDISKGYLSMRSVGYFGSAILMKIGSFFRLPFYTVYMMGKFGNLALYCAVVYFAVKIIKKGKMVLTMIALMPPTVLAAASYSYDPTVTAFMMLGFAVIFNEFLEKDKPITVKSLLIFCGSMMIASCPKAVYIPMVLAVLFLPKSKFADTKTRYWMKGAVLLVFLLMMSTFVLPALLNGANMGDNRSQNTNVGEQLRMILTHPFVYAKLMVFDNLLPKLVDFVMGTNSWLYFAYLGESVCPYLTIFTVFFVSFTDTYQYGAGKGEKLVVSGRSRLVFGILLFCILSLIWTALYLDFTPVGANEVWGVHERYYLPISAALILLLSTNKIQNTMSRLTYNRIVLGLASAILGYTVFWLVVMPYCF